MSKFCEIGKASFYFFYKKGIQAKGVMDGRGRCGKRVVTVAREGESAAVR